MLTILCSSNTGMQARQTLERKPPWWTSILSSTTSFSALRRPTSGFELVVGDDQLDRPAVDAARLVDAVDRHLGADQRGLAAGGGGARQRLQRADLVRLGLAEGGLPRRRHQHGRAQRARAGGAIADQAAARDLAAVPELFSPILRFLMVSHRASSHDVQTGPVPGFLLALSKRDPGGIFNRFSQASRDDKMGKSAPSWRRAAQGRRARHDHCDACHAQRPRSAQTGREARLMIRRGEFDGPTCRRRARLCAGQPRHPAGRARRRFPAVLPAQPQAVPAAGRLRARATGGCRRSPRTSISAPTCRATGCSATAN